MNDGTKPCKLIWYSGVTAVGLGLAISVYTPKKCTGMKERTDTYMFLYETLYVCVDLTLPPVLHLHYLCDRKPRPDGFSAPTETQVV